MEACYIAPVGHFHVEQEAHRNVEVLHPRYLNPRRVGIKKPLDPRGLRQTPTKAKRYTHSRPTQLRTPHNNPCGIEDTHKQPHESSISKRQETTTQEDIAIQELIKDKYTKPSLNRQEGLVQEI
jgi:hypothetical protein